jgi:hypothetical protein
MKTSNKILIATAGLLLALLVFTLAVLRNDMLSVIKTESVTTYKVVDVGSFNKLDVSSNWVIKIKQGYKYKVELEDGEGSSLNPQLETRAGILYFIVSGSRGKDITGCLHARVTVPDLESITVLGNSKIIMNNFQADTLKVMLGDSVSFQGHNNIFNLVSFNTSCKSWVQLSKDDWH